MGKDTLNEQIQNLGLYFPHLVNHPFRVWFWIIPQLCQNGFLLILLLIFGFPLKWVSAPLTAVETRKETKNSQMPTYKSIFYFLFFQIEDGF